MTTKHFIALADDIREHNRIAAKGGELNAFTADQIETLMAFIHRANPKFNRERWMDYLNREES